VLLGLALWAWVTLNRAPPSPPAPSGYARPRPTTGQPPLAASAVAFDTPNYLLHSTATREQTAQVAAAVERLYSSYAALFGPPAVPRQKKLVLVLYRDRQEFQANNRSSPWAEAYYLEPRSHAYYAAGLNPFHWMLHEATHQLMREVSGFKPAKWMNEGFATYMGSSTLADGALRLGEADPNAYPVWWLASYQLTGDITRDIASNQFIPLQELITDTGPGINLHVNQYYVSYWSLTHFLLHHDSGRFADGYKRLLAVGGSLEDFEKVIGPVESVEAQWYEYLYGLVKKAKAGAPLLPGVAPNNSSKPTPLRGAA
jgi:hypothetical protein